jgi:hypothetical protein
VAFGTVGLGNVPARGNIHGGFCGSRSSEQAASSSTTTLNNTFRISFLIGIQQLTPYGSTHIAAPGIVYQGSLAVLKSEIKLNLRVRRPGYVWNFQISLEFVGRKHDIGQGLLFPIYHQVPGNAVAFKASVGDSPMEIVSRSDALHCLEEVS